MRQAGALLLPSDEDGTALDNARRNKKGGECVALLEAAMKLRGHLEQVGALAISRCISLHLPIYLPESPYISLYLTISHYISPARAPRADQQPRRRARPNHGAVDLKPASSTARWDEIAPGAPSGPLGHGSLGPGG